MKKWTVVSLAAGLVLVALFVTRDPIGHALARAAFERPGPWTGPSSFAESLRVAETSAREARVEAPRRPLPAGRSRPSSEQELAEYVAWLRSLGQDELLRLSNAEFDFEESELIEMLQGLEGPWVLTALGDLAVAEQDPLLKAVLIMGLVGAYDARLVDPQFLPIVDALISVMSHAVEDPYGVAGDLASSAFEACMLSKQDYVRLMSGYLEGSDNTEFLALGYLNMGDFDGGSEILREMLTRHANADGRFGALEGLRHASEERVSSEEIATLGLHALESEANDRNRLLLYEMLIAKGGSTALDVIEQAWRGGDVSEIDKTAVMLAMKMDPARARALFEDTLRGGELTGEARQAIYNAMGVMEGEEGAEFLLGLVRNPEVDETERLAGLRGLWNRAVDEHLAGELASVFSTSEDPALRTEALRMLVHGETEGHGVDLRSVATLDDDPGVRAEAVQLAAMQPSAGTREWLEERLLEDDSLDVKAAALGALVYQAHYTGDGEAVLGYLSRARKFTDDEEALAMIAEGERMVQDYDPRNLELGLARDAEFWDTVSRFTEGPAQRAFQRQARQLSGIVAALRVSQGKRSSTR